MMVSLLSAPDESPVTLAQAKSHARIDLSTDDFLIHGFIRSATEYGERYTSRAFMPQQWEMRLDSFPACRWIDVPKPPLVSVDEVAYIDSSGVEQVFAAANYRVVSPTGPFADKGRVVLREGKSWPSAAREPDSVAVRFTAGYTVDEVPSQIETALLEYVAELYKFREQSVSGPAVTLVQVPFTVNQLLWPFVVDKIL